MHECKPDPKTLSDATEDFLFAPVEPEQIKKYFSVPSVTLGEKSILDKSVDERLFTKTHLKLMKHQQEIDD